MNDHPVKPSDSEWQQLAEQASKETDPEKVSQLIRLLCDRLDDSIAFGKTARNLQGQALSDVVAALLEFGCTLCPLGPARVFDKHTQPREHRGRHTEGSLF